MKVILLEFNELTPTLMDRFIGAGHLPHFGWLRAESQAFVTDAGESSPNLQPWIQWVTAHTGLPYAEHAVFHLGRGVDCPAPRAWDLASRAGLDSWVCGSMNACIQDGFRGLFLPDPWTVDAGWPPDAFAPYLRFVRANVVDDTREKARGGPGSAAAFLAFMLRHGLSAATVAAAIRQLLTERNGGSRWKRAGLLDRLQLDLFLHAYRRRRPAFATFFSNSTAHYQHHYWRHMDPGAFRHRPPDAEMRAYGSAVLHGYREMDRMVGSFRKLLDGDTALVLCTALSQQPNLMHEEEGGTAVYRPRDFDAVIRFAGVEGANVIEPEMSSQFCVRFDSEEHAQRAAGRLGALRAGDLAAFRIEARGERLFLYTVMYGPSPEDLPLTAADGRRARFGDLFHRHGFHNGSHHPDGLFWIRLPGGQGFAHAGKLPLTAVAPTLLKLLGVPVPPSMRGPAANLGVGA